MKLELEALDPLFFRDGRPFALGEESYASGIFPPLPSTLRGALRSMWISQQLSAPNADKDGLALASVKVSLTYFGLGIAGNPVFPVPLDLFFTEKEGLAQPMELIQPDFTSSCPPQVTHLFKADADGKTESVTGYLLELEVMQNYLNGVSDAGFATKRLSDFVKKEHKIGIGRNNATHRTKDGLLFRLVANRFVEDETIGKLSLLLDVEGFDDPQTTLSDVAVTPLGGERRSVTAAPTLFNLPAKPTISGEVFKVVLLTPGLFDSWFPAHLLDDFPGLNLVAAAVGKPVSVGGWDVLNQQPKPMRRAVPAGSVFLFEATSKEQVKEIIEEYHGKSICQPTDDLDGFGICLIAQPFNTQNLK